MRTTLDIIGNTMLYTATMLFLTIALLYHLTASWWKSSYGRFIMAFCLTISMVCVFLSGAVSGALSDSYKAWIRIAVYGIVVLVGLWLGWLINSAQRDVRKNKHASK